VTASPGFKPETVSVVGTLWVVSVYAQFSQTKTLVLLAGKTPTEGLKSSLVLLWKALAVVIALLVTLTLPYWTVGRPRLSIP
jgi:hypothetical protein